MTSSASGQPINAKATYEPRRSENPRRVRNGIRLRTRDGVVARHWIAERWLRLIESRIPADEMKEGFEYARSGQTRQLSIAPGVVEATVQGRAPRAWSVAIALPTLTEQLWQDVIEAMAGEAIYAARLLNGEIPENVADLFTAAGASVLPLAAEQLDLRWAANDEAPLRHIATIAWLVAERLDEDPTLVFDLRGLPGHRLLDRLRQARALGTRGIASAHTDPLAADLQGEVAPLEDCVEDFWGSAHRIAALADAPPSEHPSHALLKRLGPSPMSGKFPLVGLLASIYDTVSEDAIRIRDAAEGIERE